MSQRVVVFIDDDLDGTEGSAREVKFGYKGLPLRIDLKPENEEALFRALKPFIEAATIDEDNIHSNRIPPEVKALLRPAQRKKPMQLATAVTLALTAGEETPAEEPEPVKYPKGRPVADRGESGRKHSAQELADMRAWCVEHNVIREKVTRGSVANRFWEAWAKNDPTLLHTRDLLAPQYAAAASM